MSETPFFSIGVTTYDREDLLKETLFSIIKQTYKNFEVIVSNDNPKRQLSDKVLNIIDPRIRYVNQKNNLGERRNMNFLLASSKGKYFTWLADDDLYHPQFLKIIYDILRKFKFPQSLFTSYIFAYNFSPSAIGNLSKKIKLLTGKDFLKLYLNRSIKTQGCYGIFDRTYLSGLGGMRNINGRQQAKNYSFCPYADNFLAIQSGLLKKVVFINYPLIFYRAHLGSGSLTSTDFDAYRVAQDNLCQECRLIFKNNKLKDNYYVNLFWLLKWCIEDFAAVIRRANKIDRKQLILYLRFLKKNNKFLWNTSYFWAINIFTIRTIMGLVIYSIRKKLKQ